MTDRALAMPICTPVAEPYFHENVCDNKMNIFRITVSDQIGLETIKTS